MNSEEQEQAAEQWLDEAIECFRRAGPAAGLEARIIAELRARARRRRQLVFVLTGAAAAGVVAALVASLPRAVQQTPSTATQQSMPWQNDGPVSAPQSAGNQPQRSPYRPATKPKNPKVSGPGLSTHNVAGAVPKNQVFPTPSAPNEQGKRLQAYLRQTPQQELMLVATRQRAAADTEIPDLSIAPIEIKDLSPIEDKDRQ